MLLQSCASFDKELLNPHPLNESNISNINGTYKIVSAKYDSIAMETGNQIWRYQNFLTEIDRKLIKDTLKLDTLKFYSVELKILNSKELKVNYLENGKVFRERIIKTKLKKDGYLYLKNKNIQFLLIPYIFGALDIKKTRLTKSIDGHLVLDVNNHKSGAAMLVMFLNGSTHKYRKVYKPTKK